MTGTGTYVGGLVGRSAADSVHYSYWDMQTSGLTNSAGGTGYATAAMQQRETYRTYSFHSLWIII